MLNIAAALGATVISTLVKNIKYFFVSCIFCVYAYFLATSESLTSDLGQIYSMTFVVIALIQILVDKNFKLSRYIILLPVIFYFPETWQKVIVISFCYFSDIKSRLQMKVFLILFLINYLPVTSEYAALTLYGSIALVGLLIKNELYSKDINLHSKAMKLCSLMSILVSLGSSELSGIMMLAIIIYFTKTKRIYQEYYLVGFITITYLIQTNMVNMNQFVILALSLLILENIKYDCVFEKISQSYSHLYNKALCSYVFFIVIMLSAGDYSHYIVNLVFMLFGFIIFMKIQNKYSYKLEMTFNSVLVFGLLIGSTIGYLI